ncbi:hypothetical protein TEA_010235 [Camellia sinensis var. sinensis]|uniref:CTLH domain-containing protein n=2 Tax=Camellia TaxID=4441 RepID=A0A4S4EPW3_CAMSN|nr:hypothetical protein TEA_010235 [Camellia sinensis var. sinensis]
MWGFTEDHLQTLREQLDMLRTNKGFAIVGKVQTIPPAPLSPVGAIRDSKPGHKAHLNLYGDTANGMLGFRTELFRILRITFSLMHVFNVPSMMLIWILSGVGAVHRLGRDECVLHPDMLYETIGRMLQVLDGRGVGSTSTCTKHQVYYRKCQEAPQILQEVVIDNGLGDDATAVDVDLANDEVLTGPFPREPLDPLVLKSFKAHVVVAIWEQKEKESLKRIDHALQIAHSIIETGHDASLHDPDRLCETIERLYHYLQGQQIDESGPSSIPFRIYNRRRRVDDRVSNQICFQVSTTQFVGDKLDGFEIGVLMSLFWIVIRQLAEIEAMFVGDKLDGFEIGVLMSLFWIVIRQLAEIEAMATSKKVITKEEWEKKLNDVQLRKEDMNKLVMNFLVTEGYVDAAEKFRMESGTEPDIDLATITDRMAVKKAVQCGNVEDAIEKVNDLNPEILDTNPQLFFHLQQQRLIELIRNGKVEEALEFAQEELAPRGEENQSFLEELEKTVALLAFDDVTNCPVGELLDISQRLKTASEVNAAILTSQSHEKDPKLPSLLKMLLWAQNQLDEKAAYPRIKDLATATLEDPAV